MEVISNLLKDLQIEPPVILVNIIGFLILLGLMRKYFFGPIRDVLAQRQQHVAAEWDNAQEARERAETQLTELDQRTDQMMDEARREAQQAKAEVQTEGRRMIEEAHARARERQQRAQQAIAEQAAQAMAEVRNQVSDMSAEFAEQILRKSLDAERQQGLLDAAIADIEKLAHAPSASSESALEFGREDQRE